MKKLTFGTDKLVIIREAICNYCGEKKATCFRSVKPISYVVKTYATDYKMVIDDWDFSFWGSDKIIKGDWNYADVIKDRDYETKEQHSDICVDCVKEIYKFIKTKP